MRGLKRGRWSLVRGALGLAPVIVALVLSHPFGADQARGSASPAARFPLKVGHWQLKLSTVFTGNALPPAWSNSRFDNGKVAAGFNPQELECFDPSRTAVANGTLILRIVRRRQRCNGRWRPYSSGIASTADRWSFKYGLLEARVWVPSRGSKIVDWPAVWLGGKAEIDVLEGGGVPCWYYHIRKRRWGQCLSGVHIANGWHTVAVNWQPHGITWYYDHREVASVSSRVAPITSAPMSVVLDLALSSRMRHYPTAVPATFRVGWVRVWQHAG
jgi:beta-glucanase (GH16 family)